MGAATRGYRKSLTFRIDCLFRAFGPEYDAVIAWLKRIRLSALLLVKVRYPDQFVVSFHKYTSIASGTGRNGYYSWRRYRDRGGRTLFDLHISFNVPGEG